MPMVCGFLLNECSRAGYGRVARTEPARAPRSIAHSVCPLSTSAASQTLSFAHPLLPPGYPCLSTALDDRMQTSIASLGAIPKGLTPVKFIVAVNANQPRPLKFEGFKASYSNAAIERQFAPFDRCELDPIACALEDGGEEE